MIDHAYEPGPSGDDECWHMGVGAGDGLSSGTMCGLRRAYHSGESPQQDGPVRSTVERQQERILELEVKVVALEAENLYLRGQRRVLMDSGRALTQRLNHLDTLAREVGERVTRLMGTLDK